MTLTDDRRAAIYQSLHAASSQRADEYAAIIHELLDALDAEHRATLHAERAADQLWQAFDDLQRGFAPSSLWRTRDQIVGLVEEGE